MDPLASPKFNAFKCDSYGLDALDTIALHKHLICSRGLAFGVGVFETMLVDNGAIALLDFHLERMNRGALALNIDFCREPLKSQLKAIVSGLETPSCILKVSLLAGESPVRGYGAAALVPGLILVKSEPVSASRASSVSCCYISEPHCCPVKALAGLKLISASHYAHWASLALAQGYDQGVLFNQMGGLVESTQANIALQIQGRIYTPSLGDFGVRGVLREALLAADVIVMANLSEADLYQAERVYLLNSVRGAQLMTQYRGTQGLKQWNDCERDTDFQVTVDQLILN